MNRALKTMGGAGSPTPDIRDFMRKVTPEQAKAQIEEMIAKGQVTRAQVDALMGPAQAIARQLGIK